VWRVLPGSLSFSLTWLLLLVLLVLPLLLHRREKGGTRAIQ
jgi:hypothetical protein